MNYRIGVYIVAAALGMILFAIFEEHRLSEKDCQFIGFVYLAKDAVAANVNNVLKGPVKILNMCPDGKVTFEKIEE